MDCGSCGTGFRALGNLNPKPQTLKNKLAAPGIHVQQAS